MFSQNSQRRIQCDEFSRTISQTRLNDNYERALFQMQINSSSRALSKRQEEEMKELEMIEKLEKAEEEKRLREERLRVEQEFARENIEKHRRLFHEQKTRQQIRENNQELKALESKLRMAYVLKGLAAQKKEKEAFDTIEKLNKQNELKAFEEERLKYIDEQRKAQIAEKEKKRKLGEDLKNQIITAHQQNQMLYEQFLKEKTQIDEIMVRVQQELFEEASRKIKAKEQSKRDMEAFRLAKRELERIRTIEVEEENRRIYEYCQLRDKKIQEEERRRRELERQRDVLNEAMVKELTELNVSFIFH